MKLIVGLGNPDKNYDKTRHNVGFIVIDEYLSDVSWQVKFESLYAETLIAGEKVVFAKPQTYMNNSGIAVRKIADYFDIEVENILVIQDDLDIDSGKYKLKKGSSDGGHNGIKSIIAHLNTDEFARLKIGISHGKDGDSINHVLGKLTNPEQKQLEDLQPIFNKIITSFIESGIERTMNIYNTK